MTLATIGAMLTLSGWVATTQTATVAAPKPARAVAASV